VKKNIVVFLALFLVLGLADVTGQRVTLTVALHCPDIPEQTEAFLKVFESENPTIKIDVTSIGDVEPYLQPMAAAGEVPDFVSINGLLRRRPGRPGHPGRPAGHLRREEHGGRVKPQFTSPRASCSESPEGVLQPHLLPGEDLQGS
jgi:hypothetical protein